MLSCRSHKAILIPCLLLIGICNSSAALSASPTELISSYRVSQGLGRVTADSTLGRLARQQAAAMAARDVLDHDVIGSFSSRMASSRSGRAAENIAWGHDSFSKTLGQWIRSSGHRRNLLMQKASRVGVASARSARTGRTYWVMIIAGEYRAKAKPVAKGRSRERAQACRVRMLGLCLP